MGVGRYYGPYGHQLIDALLLEHLRQMGVEHHGGNTALLNIAQNKRLGLPFTFRTAIHKMKGNIQTIQVAVVRVVDKCAVADTGLYLQTHGYRLKRFQAGFYHIITHSHILANHATDSFVIINDIARTMPRDELALQIQLPDASADCLIIRGIYEGFCILEELQFLQALLLHRIEILLMGSTQTGENSQRGLDDTLKAGHLAWLRDCSLEDAYLTFLPQAPNRKGNTDLRIVATGTTRNSKIG